MEPAWRHFASPVNFHSVIYTASSVKFDPPIRQRRAATVEKSRLKVENAGEVQTAVKMIRAIIYNKNSNDNTLTMMNDFDYNCDYDNDFGFDYDYNYGYDYD